MEWISVKDELPNENSCDYLCVIKFEGFSIKNQMVVEWMFHDVLGWKFSADITGGIYYEITHWAFLPEFPKK